MRFGLILPNYGASAGAADLVHAARLAERLGFDSIWTTDHLLLPSGDAERYGVIFEAIASLAFLGGVTERVRLGISSVVLPQRSPIVVAKQLAALDVLSGGRVLLCVGVGWSAGEYRNLGYRFTNRGRRLDEGIGLLKTLWRDGASPGKRHEGKYYGFEDGVFSPTPAQPGGPPIWVGGNSEAAIRRAARLGDGWHPTGLDLERFRSGVERAREQAAGRPLTFSLRARLSFDPDNTKIPLRGEPPQIISSLRAYEAAGLEYAILTFDESSPEHRDEAIERFASDILPAFTEKA